jgi:hypothetical protein
VTVYLTPVNDHLIKKPHRQRLLIEVAFSIAHNSSGKAFCIPPEKHFNQSTISLI